MKVERTEITPRLNSYVTVLPRNESFFQSPFHFHPELELVYIKESFGKRIIGNAMDYFNAGDMVFLGSDLPHVWLNDEAYYKNDPKLKAKAIVLYFNKDIFGSLFYSLKESYKINQLFEKAARGLLVTGKTNKSIASKLEKLAKKKDFDIIVGLVEILSELSESKEIAFINNEAFVPASDKSHKDRITDVLNYVKQNFKEDITLNGISKIANLTPQSFCRMFKSRLKKHFVEYLNEVRIANACKLLLETDYSIAEIAYDCGYKTVSNFNKQFKKINGVTPKDYKAVHVG
ncbi:MAG: helix-turn-helix transcriptional regulator [Sphingobacteriales bacterium]|nr:helix-turn-helix transcriptional regulator [Sphingobacteriales bacterium]